MRRSVNALAEDIGNRFGLGTTRAETLSWLVQLIPQHGSVSLYRLAAHVATKAKIDSTRQRFRRFFETVELESTAEARFIVDQLGLAGKQGWHLALDRTNWDFGSVTHNVLVLSVLWHGTAIPLFRIMLDKKGNSDTGERTDLLGLLRAAFPDQPLASLTGDREFVGYQWLTWLSQHKIPFVMRHKENMYVFREDQVPVRLDWLARHLKPGETLNLKGGWRIGKTEAGASPPVFLAIRRLKDGRLLILASSHSAKKALNAYRLRWKIETLFGILKTKGFNLEDTHMKNSKRLSTLFGILAIAAAIAVKLGKALQTRMPVPIKKHGYPARSILALGIDAGRRLVSRLSHEQIPAALAIIISPKKPPIALIRLID